MIMTFCRLKVLNCASIGLAPILFLCVTCRQPETFAFSQSMVLGVFVFRSILSIFLHVVYRAEKLVNTMRTKQSLPEKLDVIRSFWTYFPMYMMSNRYFVGEVIDSLLGAAYHIVIKKSNRLCFLMVSLVYPVIGKESYWLCFWTLICFLKRRSVTVTI